MRTVVQAIAQALLAIDRSDAEWQAKHEEAIRDLVKKTGPSGGGIDCGTSVDFDRSRPDLLVFQTSFHHMNEHGSYDGWTNHDVIVKPSLAFGFTLRIMGNDRNGIKDYLADVYQQWLSSEVAP